MKNFYFRRNDSAMLRIFHADFRTETVFSGAGDSTDIGHPTDLSGVSKWEMLQGDQGHFLSPSQRKLLSFRRIRAPQDCFATVGRFDHYQGENGL